MMKRFETKKNALVLIVLFLSFPMLLHSQMRNSRQVRVTGWADDNNYYLQTVDSENRPVIRKVNARNGRSVAATTEPTVREIIAQALPSGVTMGVYDIVSPDGQSAVIDRDNDLYLFRMADRELKRLTTGDDPEVNFRFSPDGQKIAYTRNKDCLLYTSDAADDLLCVDLGGRRIIKKKTSQ